MSARDPKETLAEELGRFVKLGIDRVFIPFGGRVASETGELKYLLTTVRQCRPAQWAAEGQRADALESVLIEAIGQAGAERDDGSVPLPDTNIAGTQITWHHAAEIYLTLDGATKKRLAPPNRLSDLKRRDSVVFDLVVEAAKGKDGNGLHIQRDTLRKRLKEIRYALADILLVMAANEPAVEDKPDDEDSKPTKEPPIADNMKPSQQDDELSDEPPPLRLIGDPRYDGGQREALAGVLATALDDVLKRRGDDGSGGELGPTVKEARDLLLGLLPNTHVLFSLMWENMGGSDTDRLRSLISLLRLTTPGAYEPASDVLIFAASESAWFTRDGDPDAGWIPARDISPINEGLMAAKAAGTETLPRRTPGVYTPDVFELPAPKQTESSWFRTLKPSDAND